MKTHTKAYQNFLDIIAFYPSQEPSYRTMSELVEIIITQKNKQVIEFLKGVLAAKFLLTSFKSFGAGSEFLKSIEDQKLVEFLKGVQRAHMFLHNQFDETVA